MDETCVSKYQGKPPAPLRSRNPVAEVWTAKEWPKDLWAIPNNAIVCATVGMGLTALGGGDYDGDMAAVSANRNLVEFLLASEPYLSDVNFAEAKKAQENLRQEIAAVLLMLLLFSLMLWRSKQNRNI